MQPLEAVKQPSDAEWQDLLDHSPQAHDFLQTSVLASLARHEHPPAQVLKVGVRFKGQPGLVAGWAVLQRERWGRHFCRSFPLFYAGPLLRAEWCEESKVSQRLQILRLLGRTLIEDLDLLDTETMPNLPDVRGLLYADITAEQIYTHVWPEGEASSIAPRLNRSKRREMQAAAALHRFGWMQPTAEVMGQFQALHDKTLEKFKWNAPGWWKRQLTANVRELHEQGYCRVYAATKEGEASFCAAVTVLLSRRGRIAWLWRVAYETEYPGLVPALYVRAAEEVKKEFGPAWIINFGGSPRASLGLFKDYLGAVATPHWQLRWFRPGWKSLLWSLAENFKEGLRQAVYRLKEKSKLV